MKAETALKKALQHLIKIEELIEPINSRLADILEDQSAHVLYQAGDGFVVSYREGLDNAGIDSLDMDSLLKMGKAELLAVLDENSV